MHDGNITNCIPTESQSRQDSWEARGQLRDLQRVYTATVQRTTPTTPCSGGACLRCAPHTGCYACRVRRWHSALTCARALRGAARRL